MEDDVLPLSTPVQKLSGETVDRVSITTGTSVTVPIRCVNRCVEIWGPDAKEFIPERWLDESGLTAKSKEIQTQVRVGIGCRYLSSHHEAGGRGIYSDIACH